MNSLVKDLTNLLNEHSVETDSDTPDFVLAGLLEDVLKAFAKAVRARDDFHKAQGVEQDGVLSVREYYQTKSTYEKYTDKQNENKGTAIDQ